MGPTGPHEPTLLRCDETDRDFLKLVDVLDAELRVRDGDIHGFYAQFNKPVGLAGVVIVYVGGDAVGCGAFKRYDDSAAEIKRMFVIPEMRGKRFASMILSELERWASEAGFTECVLETGFKQPEAIALYIRSGYEVIPNYGQYAGIETSVCMRRRLE